MTYTVNPPYLDFEAKGGSKVVDITVGVKYIGVKSNSKWIRVSPNGKTVTVDVEENKTGERRDGGITIVMSQDEKSILATVSVPVRQSATSLEEQPLTFIDTESLAIEKIETSIFPRAGFFSYTKTENNSVIHPENISVLKISDYVYQVRAHYDNPMGYHYERQPPNRPIDESKPYGIYFDISFYIESIAPFYHGDTYNMMARDIEISGYSKDVSEWVGDELTEFSGTVSRADLGAFSPSGKAEFSTTASEYRDIATTVNGTETYKTWEDHGHYDADGNWVSKWEIVTTRNKRQGSGDEELFIFTVTW